MALGWWALSIYWLIGGIIAFIRGGNAVYVKFSDMFPQYRALPIWIGKTFTFFSLLISGGITFPISVYGIYLDLKYKRLLRRNEQLKEKLKKDTENLEKMKTLMGVLKEVLEEKYGK